MEQRLRCRRQSPPRPPPRRPPRRPPPRRREIRQNGIYLKNLNLGDCKSVRQQFIQLRLRSLALVLVQGVHRPGELSALGIIHGGQRLLRKANQRVF